MHSNLQTDQQVVYPLMSHLSTFLALG